MFWTKMKAIKETLIQAAPAVLVVVAIAVLIALGIRATEGCSSGAGGDYFEDAKRAILEQVESDRAKSQERLEALEADLYDLRDQVDALDAEAKASAREREEIHDAIQNAATIDDVDRILRAGIPGVSGRKR